MDNEEFYAIINGKEFKKIEEYNNYMKGQFYFDNKKILLEKMEELINNLQENIYNGIGGRDKSINLEITLDKSGYVIKTHKEYYD